MKYKVLNVLPHPPSLWNGYFLLDYNENTGIKELTFNWYMVRGCEPVASYFAVPWCRWAGKTLEMKVLHRSHRAGGFLWRLCAWGPSGRTGGSARGEHTPKSAVVCLKACPREVRQEGVGWLAWLRSSSRGNQQLAGRGSLVRFWWQTL